MFSIFLLIKELLVIISPRDKKNLIGVLFLVILMALIESAGVVSIMPFLAVLANPSIVESNSFLIALFELTKYNSHEEFIALLGGFSILIIFFSSLFKIFTQYKLIEFSSIQRHKLSSRLLKLYLQQDYEFFIQRNSSSLIKNVLSETDQLIWSLIQPVLVLISYCVVIIAMTILLLFYDLLMAITLATILISFYFTAYKIIKIKLDIIGESFAHANKMRYKSCQEALGGIKDIIVNNAQNGYIEDFNVHSKVFARNLATKDILGQVPRYFIEAIGYSCLIGLSIFLVISGKNVSHILPVLGLYGFAAYRMLPAAQNIYISITQIKFTEHIFKKLKTEFNLESKNEHIEYKEQDILVFNKGIYLKNISFSYPSRPSLLVLDDFNLKISKNQTIGIVGKSGKGKSTLMDVILGLLKPQDGKVYIDDVELTLSNMHLWHKIVGYVPQDIYLIDKSIAENIAFGVNKYEINMEAVIYAAQLANIDNFIREQLSNGYHTTIGERGVMLSGGQKQRIGIARALYKDPSVLLFDEATSSLDIETECEVNKTIQSLKGFKTVIIIAHRTSTLSNCDMILSL